jgi:hypothetical protein
MTNYDDYEAGPVDRGDKIATSAKWYSTAATNRSMYKGKIDPYKLR